MTNDGSNALLKVDGLVSGYGKKQVVNGVSLEVGTGEIVALIGHNGAGKSTLLKAVFGLVPIWSGRVFLDGEARTNQRGERLWPALFRAGVAEEESRNREEAMRWLRFVGLEEKAQEPAGELSYGQQKLLTLAVCLATEARVLLLDEPVAGVHPEMAEKIVGLLRQLRDAGKLVVFIEHDMAAVRQAADHVIVMDDGKVIAQGQPGEVLERPEIMEAYVG